MVTNKHSAGNVSTEKMENRGFENIPSGGAGDVYNRNATKESALKGSNPSIMPSFADSKKPGK